MKALLKILYILLFLVIVILLAGIFLPKTIKIEVKKEISASSVIVFNQVNNLKNWENWSPWLSDDLIVKLDYNDIPEGKGAEFRWKDKSPDAGSIRIVESKPEQEISMKVDFGEQGDANILWKFKNEKEFIKVSWIFENKDMAYFERYFMFIFKMNIRNNLKQGLVNLKAVCEDLRLSRIAKIGVLELESQPAMIIIDSATVQDMDAKMKEIFRHLDTYIARRDIVAAGNRFAIFFNWDPKGLSTFACGYPIAEKTWGWKEYTYFELPAGKTAMLTHWGRYDSEKPYLALDDYLKNNNLKQGKFIWEEYVISSENEPDTSLWEKKIFYPLKP